MGISMKSVKGRLPKNLKGLAKANLDFYTFGLGGNLAGLGEKRKGQDYSAYDSEQANIMKDLDGAYDEFAAGGPARYDAGDSLIYQNLDPYSLDQLGRSGYEDIVTDPRHKQAEIDALAQLEERSREGLSAQDRVDMARLEGAVNRQNAGRMGAIRQNMASRGLSGSGMDMLAQMQAGQDATEMEAIASLEKAAQMQNNKRAASVDAGNMAGRMRSQAFEEDAAKAAARDSINRFNTQNRVQVQVNNNQGQNQTANANWNRRNATSDRNSGAQYQFNQDKLGARQSQYQTQYNYSTDRENAARQAEAQKNAKRAAEQGMLYGIAGGVVGGYFGGPAGAQAGSQMGQQVGANNANYYAEGGYIQGEDAGYPGDDIRNDTVDIKASPGEMMLPKTISNDPVKASEFVAEQNGEEMDAIGHLLAAMTMLNKGRK